MNCVAPVRSHFNLCALTYKAQLDYEKNNYFSHFNLCNL